MNTQLLKKLYSIHSPSGKEQNMIRFLRSYIGTLPGDISVSQDRYGNLYVIKGTGENYPCLVSHIDQVAHCHHSKDFKAIETKDIIFGYSPGKRRFENPGADDKNGIFICLECLKKYDTIKIAFFREEETGCAGSSNADMPFFNDVRFVIQPDRKGNSDLITSIGFSELCSDEFIEAVKPEEWGYKENNGVVDRRNGPERKRDGRQLCQLELRLLQRPFRPRDNGQERPDERPVICRAYH